MNIDNQKRLPSEEKPWLKWHAADARRLSTEPVEQISMCQLIERQLRKQGDKYPAFKYFGKTIQRSEVLANIERWARMFRGMGVGVDERVILFVPFTPEAGYMILALNKIGAWAVMLNLGSSAEALAKGSEGARFAVVADAVEPMIAHVFRNNPAFERVILVSISTDMAFPVKQVMSLKDAGKKKALLKDAKNYMTSSEALKRWGNYQGEIDAPCEMERPALVTSSGGTSTKGYAKQIMDSNRAVVSMIKQTQLTTLPPRYAEGSVCYTGFPPFISTSTLVLFLLPLYYNMTCCMDPRLDPKIFTENVLKFKANVCCAPGRCWIYFFTQVERQIKKGKTPDLSFFTMPIMGGDGVIVKDLRWMNDLLRQCGSKVGICSGYGMSEMFSLLSVDCREGFAADGDTESVVSVGIPMPGSDVAIMDEDGNELGYGERGEICVKGMTLMLGYYNDVERTNAAVRNGWYHSGDLGSIDEDGNIYIYSRLSDCCKTETGEPFYPIDLETLINRDKDVHCSMVNNMAPEGQKPRLAVHLVFDHDVLDKEVVLRRIDNALREFLHGAQSVEGYKIHRHIFKMSSVLKIDRNYYKEQRTGYIRPEGEKLVEVSFN